MKLALAFVPFGGQVRERAGRVRAREAALRQLADLRGLEPDLAVEHAHRTAREWPLDLERSLERTEGLVRERRL